MAVPKIVRYFSSCLVLTVSDTFDFVLKLSLKGTPQKQQLTKTGFKGELLYHSHLISIWNTVIRLDVLFWKLFIGMGLASDLLAELAEMDRTLNNSSPPGRPVPWFHDKLQIVCQISTGLCYLSFPKSPFLVTSFLAIHKLFSNHIFKLRVPKEILNPLGLTGFSLLFRSCHFNFHVCCILHAWILLSVMHFS